MNRFRFMVSRGRRILKVYNLDSFDELKESLNSDFGFVDDLTVLAELVHDQEIWAYHVSRNSVTTNTKMFILNDVTGVRTPFEEIPTLGAKNWNFWIRGQCAFSMKFHSVRHMKEFFAGISPEYYSIYLNGDLVKVICVDDIDHGIELKQFEI